MIRYPPHSFRLIFTIELSDKYFEDFIVKDSTRNFLFPALIIDALGPHENYQRCKLLIFLRPLLHKHFFHRLAIYPGPDKTLVAW